MLKIKKNFIGKVSRVLNVDGFNKFLRKNQNNIILIF